MLYRKMELWYGGIYLTMTYDIISTGSTGNCIILNGIIALDMGVSYKKVAPHVRGLQLVFVGHEHSDHIKQSTIRALAAERPRLRFCGGEWMAGKFILAGVSTRNIDVLEAGKRYDYGTFQIEPVPLRHDVPNYGLKIYINGKKVIYIVDTGYVDDVDAKDFDLFLLESNHTQAEISARIAEKQERGEFAYEFRAAQNHLSQEQAMDWLARNAGPQSRYVFLHGHQDKNPPPITGADGQGFSTESRYF